MARSFRSINLLGNNRQELVEQITNWAVTIGRGLVIVIEVVALVAFLYRFSLDGQLQDLQTKIKQEQAIVLFQKDNENTYRNLQERLSIASLFLTSANKEQKVFEDIISFAPAGISFSNISLSPDGIQIQADANSVSSLSTFINKLRAYSSISSVSLDKIENKTSSAVITFGISASLKQKGGTNANF